MGGASRERHLRAAQAGRQVGYLDDSTTGLTAGWMTKLRSTTSASGIPLLSQAASNLGKLFYSATPIGRHTA
jgi:hypothetical protein